MIYSRIQDILRFHQKNDFRVYHLSVHSCLSLTYTASIPETAPSGEPGLTLRGRRSGVSQQGRSVSKDDTVD